MAVQPSRKVLGALLAAVVIGGLTPTAVLAEGCILEKLAEIPVTMKGLRATTPAKINGTSVRMLIDSGAFWSGLTQTTAAELKLPLQPAPWGLTVWGVGGHEDVSIATARTVALYNVTAPYVQFLVEETHPGRGVIGGTLGQNLLRLGDIEYDFAHGVMRILRPPEGCRHMELAYWASESEPFSVMDIDRTTSDSPSTIGTALLNGTKIRVLFDTGTGRTTVTRRAAERARVNVTDPGVVEIASATRIHEHGAREWIATFASFKIGQEEVKNSELRIDDFTFSDLDMLLGVDFFLSHRIYVATSQHKVYFTYNGGPVFD